VVTEQAARLFHEMFLQIADFKVTHGAIKAAAAPPRNAQGVVAGLLRV
jgi:hypothetical protein